MAEEEDNGFDDDFDEGAEVSDDDLDILFPASDDLDDEEFWEYNDEPVEAG